MIVYSLYFIEMCMCPEIKKLALMTFTTFAPSTGNSVVLQHLFHNKTGTSICQMLSLINFILFLCFRKANKWHFSQGKTRRITCYKQGREKTSMNTHHIKEDGLQQKKNTLVDHSCQLRKENWGYTLAWLTKHNIGKMCPGLMISAATFTGSQFGIDNTCNTAMWITLWPQSTHLLTAVSSSIMWNVTMLRSSQTGFLKMRVSSLYSNGHHCHQICQ